MLGCHPERQKLRHISFATLKIVDRSTEIGFSIGFGLKNEETHVVTPIVLVKIVYKWPKKMKNIRKNGNQICVMMITEYLGGRRILCKHFKT